MIVRVTGQSGTDINRFVVLVGTETDSRSLLLNFEWIKRALSVLSPMPYRNAYESQNK